MNSLILRGSTTATDSNIRAPGMFFSRHKLMRPASCAAARWAPATTRINTHQYAASSIAPTPLRPPAFPLPFPVCVAEYRPPPTQTIVHSLVITPHIRVQR